jgi:hypothetical protein
MKAAFGVVKNDLKPDEIQAMREDADQVGERSALYLDEDNGRFAVGMESDPVLRWIMFTM